MSDYYKSKKFTDRLKYDLIIAGIGLFIFFLFQTIKSCAQPAAPNPTREARIQMITGSAIFALGCNITALGIYSYDDTYSRQSINYLGAGVGVMGLVTFFKGLSDYKKSQKQVSIQPTPFGARLVLSF